MIHGHIASHRLIGASGTFLIEEIDLQYRVLYLANLDMAHENVLQYAAADGVGFQAQGAHQVGAAHFAVFHEHVAAAAGNFAADGGAGVAVPHGAIANDEVHRGNAHPAAVVVAAGFDCDAVIAGVEQALLDQHVPAAFGVAAVVIGAVGRDVDPPYGDIGAEQRMNFPHRRAADFHAFDQNVLAALKLDEIGPQEIAFAKPPLFHGHTIVVHFVQPRPGRLLGAFAGALAAFPSQPRGVIRLAIKCAGAAHRHVLLSLGEVSGE